MPKHTEMKKIIHDVLFTEYDKMPIDYSVKPFRKYVADKSAVPKMEESKTDTLIREWQDEQGYNP